MKRNIIFIIVDALRARNLECYGYDKPTSPNISNIAANGVLFEKAFSTTNATDPSLTSIFSGKHPVTTGIRNHGEKVTEIEKKIAEELLTLPKILKESGYVTLGVNWLGRWHKKGFHFYGIEVPWYRRFIGSMFSFAKLIKFASEVKQVTSPVVYDISDVEQTTRTAIHLLKRNRKNRFFLYVHFWGTHTPYKAPKTYTKFFYDNFYRAMEQNETIENILKNASINSEWRAYLESWLNKLPNLGYVLAHYDAAIAFIDRQIGKLYRTLIDLKILDDTNVIITADHGESLCEHEIYFDHHGLYDETIHIPLIFSGPDFPKGKKIGSLVQHVDIIPTLLDMLEIPIDKFEFDGFSLLPLILGETNRIRPFIISEESYTEEKMAIRTEEWKYITSPSTEVATCRYCNVIHGGTEELYNLKSDPKETCNVVMNETETAEKLRKELFEWLAEVKTIREKREIRMKINKLRAHLLRITPR